MRSSSDRRPSSTQRSTSADVSICVSPSTWNGVSVRAGMDRCGVLQPECTLPENVVGADDRGREAGNTRLCAQRLDVVAEASEDQVLGRQRHPDQQGQGDRQNEQGTAVLGVPFDGQRSRSG